MPRVLIWYHIKTSFRGVIAYGFAVFESLFANHKQLHRKVLKDYNIDIVEIHGDWEERFEKAMK